MVPPSSPPGCRHASPTCAPTSGSALGGRAQPSLRRHHPLLLIRDQGSNVFCAPVGCMPSSTTADSHCHWPTLLPGRALCPDIQAGACLITSVCNTAGSLCLPPKNGLSRRGAWCVIINRIGAGSDAGDMGTAAASLQQMHAQALEIKVSATPLTLVTKLFACWTASMLRHSVW